MFSSEPLTSVIHSGQARDVGSYTLLSVGTRGQRESEVGL